MFKAKAEAEKKKLQAQGMKAGEDFVDCTFIVPPNPSSPFSGWNVHLQATPDPSRLFRIVSDGNSKADYCSLLLAQLKGVQQAEEVKLGVGSIGGLKKQL